jgi:hypothetical protein
LGQRRRAIQEFADERYSWSKVAASTTAVYSQLAGAEIAPPARRAPEQL